MKKVFRSEVELEIPFHDVDAMKIVWHGNYYKYFEIARTNLLKSLNFDINAMDEAQYLWPVIESHCRYIRPLKYGMKIIVIATLKEFKHRLRIEYQIKDADAKISLCKGHTVHVAFNRYKQEMCFNSPKILYEILGIKEPP